MSGDAVSWQDFAEIDYVDDYQEVELSPTFPQVPKSKLYEFWGTARQDEVEAKLALRVWARSPPKKQNPVLHLALGNLIVVVREELT